MPHYKGGTGLFVLRIPFFSIAIRAISSHWSKCRGIGPRVDID